MYGLPHQTVATITDTAERALTLRPDRIALFGYAHVPWMKRPQKLIPQETLPGSQERFAQGRAAAEVFVGSGYWHARSLADMFRTPRRWSAIARDHGRRAGNYAGMRGDGGGSPAWPHHRTADVRWRPVVRVHPAVPIESICLSTMPRRIVPCDGTAATTWQPADKEIHPHCHMAC
jgi:hypothetical protein